MTDNENVAELMLKKKNPKKNHPRQVSEKSY